MAYLSRPDLQPYEHLEQEFAAWAGVENVVAASSGTSALHLSLEALRLPLGSEVLCPEYTMIACPRAIVLAGLNPVFVDCGEDLLINPNLIEKAVTEKTRAILVVHIYGRRADMKAVMMSAVKHDLYVIEDLAEAHGVRPHPDTDAACFSFYRNKIIAGEEGGAVAFRCPEAAALAKSLRSLGFTADHDFLHIPRGCNYRMSNAHAALILDSLAEVDANLARRREIEGWYNARCPAEWKMPAREVCWVFDLRIPGLWRDKQTEIVRTLNKAGIAARHFFQPMTHQEEFRKCQVVGGANAAAAAREGIYLPVQPDFTTPDSCRRAFELIHQVLHG